jgi:hypothetical protein
MGREWKVCGSECIRKMQLRYAKSVLGEENSDVSNAITRVLEENSE